MTMRLMLSSMCWHIAVSKREQVSAQEAIADASPADQQLLQVISHVYII